METPGKVQTEAMEVAETDRGDGDAGGDLVDGGCLSLQKNGNGRSDNDNNGNGHGRGDEGDDDGEDVENVDVKDILIPPIFPRRQQQPLPHPSSAHEASDSKKFFDALKKRLTRRPEDVEGPFASCDPSDFEYNMSHKNRGRAIIFNHTEFSEQQRLQPRPGSTKDAIDLKATLERLGFTVDVYTNVTYSKLYSILEKASLDNHTDNDCIVVVALTHGKPNALHAYDVEYLPENIWNFFTADKCSTLAGKPKLFFIQACRGYEYDDGTMLMRRKSRTVVDGPGDGKAYKIPNHADILVVFSTTPGHFSWRNSQRGGCFIQALCRILDGYAEHMDLLSLLTMVNREVAITYESNVPRDVTQHQKKQVPHVTHTLTRQIRLANKSPVSTLV